MCLYWCLEAVSSLNGFDKLSQAVKEAGHDAETTLEKWIHSFAARQKMTDTTLDLFVTVIMFMTTLKHICTSLVLATNREQHSLTVGSLENYLLYSHMGSFRESLNWILSSWLFKVCTVLQFVHNAFMTEVLKYRYSEESCQTYGFVLPLFDK